MNKLLLTFTLIVFCPAAFSSSQYITTKDNINVRLDSTVNSPSLGYLSKNDIVEVIGEKFGWYRIKLPKKFSCYISGKYVEEIEPGKVKVTGSKVNLRSKPSLGSDILGQATKGTIFAMLGKTNQWVKIQGYPYISGWVHTKFLKEYEKSEDLKLLVEEIIPKLSESDIEKKKQFHKELIDRGGRIVSLLEPYLSKTDKNTSYSIIVILTELGRNNPELVSYFLEKVDSSPLKAASIYLDVVQDIIKSDDQKIAYFYLAEKGELSEQDLKQARSLLEKALEDFKNEQ